MKFIISAVLLFMTVNAHAIFGIEKILPDLNLFKAEMKGDVNGIKADVEKLVDINMKLDARMTANTNAIAGVGNSLTKMSVGRDSITTNDSKIYEMQTELMWKIIYGLLGLIGTLVANQFWIVKRLFKEMSNARFYQVQLASQMETGKIEEIMKLKREIEERNSLTKKASNVVGRLLKKEIIK